MDILYCIFTPVVSLSQAHINLCFGLTAEPTASMSRADYKDLFVAELYLRSMINCHNENAGH